MKLKPKHGYDQLLKFENKFGHNSYELFYSLRDTIKKHGYSTDTNIYIKNPHWTKEKLISMLKEFEVEANEKRNRISIDNIKITGRYNYYGECGGYKVYEPLDVESSISTGIGTGWCTAGRYNHIGNIRYKPSVEDAKKHFREYQRLHTRTFVFLDSKTLYGKYVLTIYLSSTAIKINENICGEFWETSNFELENASNIYDYEAFKNIPIQLVPVKLNVVTIINGEKTMKELN